MIKGGAFLVPGGSPGEGHSGVPAGAPAASGLSLTDICFPAPASMVPQCRSNCKRVSITGQSGFIMLLCGIFGIYKYKIASVTI